MPARSLSSGITFFLPIIPRMKYAFLLRPMNPRRRTWMPFKHGECMGNVSSMPIASAMLPAIVRMISLRVWYRPSKAKITPVNEDVFMSFGLKLLKSLIFFSVLVGYGSTYEMRTVSPGCSLFGKKLRGLAYWSNRIMLTLCFSIFCRSNQASLGVSSHFNFVYAESSYARVDMAVSSLASISSSAPASISSSSSSSSASSPSSPMTSASASTAAAARLTFEARVAAMQGCKATGDVPMKVGVLV
mmetsp:Transcript_5400/g.15078  ORF Transcript_5400/g.15078 Transcript_5400/m.15078 type:complete len:245 (-) Transcript_5400:163-897(-)